MKKTRKFSVVRAAASSVALISFLFALASCEQLQDSLSSELNAKMLEETGSPSLVEKAWYYAGTAGEDVSTQTGFLRINYGQQVKAGEGGLSGSLTIAYTDYSSGNETTVKKSLAGGMASGTDFCLDMTPVIEMLNGTTFKNGTASVQVSLSGLICNAGKQAGRNVSSLNTNIKIKPLFTSDSFDINSKSAVAGTKFAIPLNGAVSLTSNASISVSNSDVGTCSLAGLSADGKSIYFVSDTDLSGKSVETTVTVSGILPVTDVVEQEYSWTVNFVPFLYSGAYSGTENISCIVPASELSDLEITSLTISATDCDWSNVSGKWWIWAYSSSSEANATEVEWKANTYYTTTVTDSDAIAAFKASGIYLKASANMSCTLNITYGK